MIHIVKEQLKLEALSWKLEEKPLHQPLYLWAAGGLSASSLKLLHQTVLMPLRLGFFFKLQASGFTLESGGA
ncbi:MAG: hypothetical protein ACQEUM_18445, partial [Pseudomonadota bacterium]